MNDEISKIFINPDSDRQGLSEEMDSFLNLLQSKTDLKGLAKRINDAVGTAKEHREWEVEFMTMQLMIQEERAEAKAEGIAEGKAAGIAEGKAAGIAEGKAAGIAEGKAAGIAEGKAEIIRHLLQSGKTPNEISDFCGFNLEEIIKIANK